MSDHDSRIIALDFGQVRIGVAVSDPDGRLAQPLCVINRVNREQDVREISRLAALQNARLLVMGLPRKNDEELGETAKRVLSFGKRLGRVLQLPVAYVDEFETTVEAEEALIAAHMPRDRRKKVVDMLAASLILRRYLEGQSEGENPAHG